MSFSRRRPPPAGPELPAMGRVTLRIVAEHAGDLVPAFLAFTASCSTVDEPPTGIGREGHRLASEFGRLHAWVRDGEVEPGTERVREELLQNLAYHGRIVHDAVRLAFPRVRTIRTEGYRLALGEVQPPTRALLALRDLLAEADGPE